MLLPLQGALFVYHQYSQGAAALALGYGEVGLTARLVLLTEVG